MGRQSVFVVAAGDTVQARDVTATAWTGSDWVIERGLAPGDRVIVDGVQKVFPGAKVRAGARGGQHRAAAPAAGVARP